MVFYQARLPTLLRLSGGLQGEDIKGGFAPPICRQLKSRIHGRSYRHWEIVGILFAKAMISGVRTRQLVLGRTDLSGEIEDRYRNETDVRVKYGSCV